MLWIILSIGLIFLITGIVFCCMGQKYWHAESRMAKFRNYLYQNSWIYWALNVIGGFVTSIACIALISVSATYQTNLKTLDNKIMMYQTENAEIESTIETIVEDYKDYEQSIFNTSKEGIDPVILYSMYPELKSNELVNTQMNIYIQNKDSIKELKSQQIDNEALTWWLYLN